jgi:serine/threonine-protein kinase
MPLAHPSLKFQPSSVVSYWRLGAPITGGRWYNIFRAAPKLAANRRKFDYLLKLVNPDLTGDDHANAIDRLGREATVTEQLQHPNVVRLLDAELDQPPFFVVQPWVYGRSLDRLLSAELEIPVNRVLWTIRQIAEGIRAAHDSGRVYLGLEPSHVMLGKNGRVTLLGWSQSHLTGQKVWFPNDQLQTVRYTAPECFEEGYVASAASDVYSLGAMIYHLFSLQPPLQSQSIKEMMDAQRDEIPEDLIIRQPLCPPAMSALVKQMLAKQPQQRPSFREVMNELIAIEISQLSNQTLIAL